jgi:uncharacterized RDD family membrane protein YckC
MTRYLGLFFRIIAAVAIFVLVFIDLLTVLTSFITIPDLNLSDMAVLLHRFGSGFFMVILGYGLYLTITNSQRYFKVLAYFLPAHFLFITIWRYFFITSGQFEQTDIYNFFLYGTPLLMAFLSYKLNHPHERIQTKLADSNVLPEAFTPLEYQGIIVRGMANLIDQAFILVPLFALSVFFRIDAGDEILVEIGAGLFFIYLIISEALTGQTLGKKLFHLQVMMVDGRECTVMGAVLRNLFRILDLILGGYLLAMLVMTISPKRQRIGDLIAKTVVIRRR